MAVMIVCESPPQLYYPLLCRLIGGALLHKREIHMVLGLGIPELVIILVVILIIFGPKNLPKLGKSLGSTIKSVREGLEDGEEKEGADDEQKAVEAGEDYEYDEDIIEDEDDADIDEDAVADDGVFCNACGTKNPGGAGFCSSCGEKLA